MSSMESLAEPRDPAIIITRGLSDWWLEEHHTSGKGRNEYLDNLEQNRKNLLSSPDDPFNTSMNKAMAHLSRPTGVWWQAFIDSPNNDYFMAQQIFAYQMLASGAIREQNMLQAQDTQDYFRRKFSENPLGVDILGTVTDRLIERYAVPSHAIDFRNGNITLEELFTNAQAGVQIAVETITHLHTNGRDDIAKETSPTVDRLKNLQRVWVSLAVDHIAFAAQEREGDLSRVPFLQPISISDQPENPVYYPFAA